MDVILGQFAENPQLGIVFPCDPNIIAWRSYRPQAIALLERMGIGAKLFPGRHNVLGQGLTPLRRCFSSILPGATIRPSLLLRMAPFCTRWNGSFRLWRKIAVLKRLELMCPESPDRSGTSGMAV